VETQCEHHWGSYLHPLQKIWLFCSVLIGELSEPCEDLCRSGPQAGMTPVRILGHRC
jgi:hypothetical protein